MARNYLKKEKDSLNAFLRQNINQDINQDTPSIEPLDTQFGLIYRLFKQLFIEEFGESFMNYYRKLRISLANEYLKRNQTKVYKASQFLGYYRTIAFI